MDQGSLVSEEIDAGEQLVRAFDKYLPVKAAFWLKTSDDPHRYLYIASEQIDDNNFDLAYREVIRLTHKFRNPDLDPFRVKVINAGTPLAQAAVEILERFPDSVGTRSGGGYFGGLVADDVYIYPAQRRRKTARGRRR